MMRASAALIMLLLCIVGGCDDDLCPTSPTDAALIVLRPDGTGDFPTIQAALVAADSLSAIVLTNGVYSGPGNRDIDFLGRPIVLRSQNGDPALCILDCQGDSLDPHRAFDFSSGEGSASIVEGITIANGYAEWDGGGVLCRNGSSPTFENCVFAGNLSRWFGGAVSCAGSSPSLVGCEFRENWAGNHGGALWLRGGSSPTISNCLFSENEAAYFGGACCFWEESRPTMSTCHFVGNAGQLGGALHCVTSAPTLIRCTFEGNSADFAGAIDCARSSPLFVACWFSDNAATDSGGAVSLSQSFASLTGCTFLANSAGESGGGIACSHSSPLITNCTLYANTAARGSGIYCKWDSSPALERVIVAFGEGGAAIDCHETGYANAPLVLCSDLYGNEGGDWVGCVADQAGTGRNISEDPIFLDPETADFRLHPESPCGADSSSCGRMGAWRALGE